MHIYEPRKFTFPNLNGISEKSIEEHLALYSGYVKNFNDLSKQIAELAMSDWEKYALPVAEMSRRRSFEFDGMRLHEYYFEQLEGGAQPLPAGEFAEALQAAYKPKNLEEVFKKIAAIRGPGWAVLYYDPVAKELLTGFIGEQHQGHYATLPIILALDVWEHAYILDHGAAGRGKYIDAFFSNLNWDVLDKRYKQFV